MDARNGWSVDLSGTRSAALQERRTTYVPGCISSLVPAYAASASGSVIEDVDGNRWIDFTGGWGCMAAGHAAPEVVTAICDQAHRFTHTDFSVVPYEAYVELAERLAHRAPCSEPVQVALFNSGAEAVENAVKTARKHTGRDAIVVFSGAFHGRTMMAMTMTHKEAPYKAGFGPFAPEVYRVAYPDPYRSDGLFDAFAADVEKQVDPQRIAAVVIEPIQGEGGFVVAPPAFLVALRGYTERHGALLVVDEIQSGFGRTGKFFAIEHAGISPDILTVGKSIAAGLPLSAVIASRAVFDSLDAGSLGGTYVGNPIACRAALAVLSIMDREDLLARATSIGRVMEERFERLRSRHEEVGDVRGVGAMRAIEFVKSREGKEPDPALCSRVISGCLNRGLIVAGAGYHRNVVRMLLPLTTPEGLLQAGLDILDRAVADACALAPSSRRDEGRESR